MPNNKMDVIDVFTQLKQEFSHVEFMIKDVEKRFGLGVATFHTFKLVRLNNQNFNPPIPTSLFFRKDNYIDENVM
jgi:hypothetical protein